MKYSVIVTRDCTESAVVKINASSPEKAQEKALSMAIKNDGADLEWEADDCSGMQSDPYTTGCDKI